MMKKILFILILPLLLFGQRVEKMDAYNLFSSTETVTHTTDGIPYFTMTDTDTATSKLIVMNGGKSGDVRVSVVIDTISGTLSAAVYMGIKVGEFGSESLNYNWVSLGTISASDNNTTKTYLMSDYSEWDSPVEGYKIRIITSGNQSDKVYVNVLQYYPHK